MLFSRHASLTRAIASAVVSVLLLAGAVFGASTVGFGSRPAAPPSVSFGAPERSPIETVLAALGLHEDADEADSEEADENEQGDDTDERGEDAENCDVEDENENEVEDDADEAGEAEDVEDEDVDDGEARTAAGQHGAAVSAVAKDPTMVDLTPGGQCNHGGAVSKAAHDKAEAARKAAAEKAREAAERAREAARRHAEDRDDDHEVEDDPDEHETESDHHDRSGEHESDDDSGGDD